MKHWFIYGYKHAFTMVFKCDKRDCNHQFKLGERIYKHPRNIEGFMINYYYCEKHGIEFENHKVFKQVTTS